MGLFVILVCLASAITRNIMVIATPTTLRTRSGQEFCGQWDTSVVELDSDTGSSYDRYIVYNNLWGASSAESGAQCSVLNGLAEDTIAWTTSWTWQGNSNQVKSYASVGCSLTPIMLSSINSLDTEWSWSYHGHDIVADVSYDMFTSSSPGNDAYSEYEIMVWIAAIGAAFPISSTGSPLATPVIGGIYWNLYSGPRDGTTVYSFVAQTTLTNFQGDLNQFFIYLEKYQGVSSSQYLNKIQAGTEPFTGSHAKFKTTSYNIKIA